MEVALFDAKNRLSALVAEAEHGREITITRRGIPVAKLVPITPGFDRDKAARAADGLRQASRGLSLGGLTIRELIEEGRS